ncbi:hypothetical protein RMATCC62417_17666 [Rhizopus microsporus]|nr:hypothetical protein RMATCC62417_17666 [Rhizopus microsporus]
MCSLDNPKPHAEIQCSTYSNCQDPSWSATLLMAQRHRSANITTSSAFGSTSFAASSTAALANFLVPDDTFQCLHTMVSPAAWLHPNGCFIACLESQRDRLSTVQTLPTRH